MIYLDTSALVKKYVAEIGTLKLRALLRGVGDLATSKLTYAEATASFARKRRDGGIGAAAYKSVIRGFEEDWQRLTVVELTDDLLPRIKSLVERHGLRGADAVHLASALWLGAALSESIVIVASDVHLLGAATREGLDTYNPERE